MINMPNPRSDWKPTEFEIICSHGYQDRETFIKRLVKNLRTEGECQIWTGHTDKNGYARIDFRLPGTRPNRNHSGKHVKIGVHRLFLTLKLCRPIRPLHEAGHYGCLNPLCVVHVEEQTREENIGNVRRGKKTTDDCPL